MITTKVASTKPSAKDDRGYSAPRPASSGAPDCDVVIIGAGPYGLSAAAHLKSQGLNIRVFGEPMEFWNDKMPAGMLLRSPREASNISGPKGTLTLEDYESAAGIPAAKLVPRETFVNYGRWFKEHLGSSFHRTFVTGIGLDKSIFRIALEDGGTLTSRKVVVAAGIGPFRTVPAPFDQLPPALASHCYEGRNIAEFRGRRVAVIGAGQSALESAALLHENGVEVELIARVPALRWVGMHGWLHHLGPVSKMLYSKHDVGPLGISKLVACPNVMRHVPLGMRDKIRRRAIRSAGIKWLVSRLAPVKVTTGRSVKAAQPQGDEVRLTLDDGSERRVHHVLLGTGYSVNIAQYRFLPPEIVGAVRQLDGYPILGPGFSSSVPGLHFIGAPAARSFGPLLYFIAGTEFCSQSLAAQVLQSQ